MLANTITKLNIIVSNKENCKNNIQVIDIKNTNMSNHLIIKLYWLASLSFFICRTIPISLPNVLEIIEKMEINIIKLAKVFSGSSFPIIGINIICWEIT